MWPEAPAFDAEVGLNQADAHVMNEDWDGAIRVLGRYLSRDPVNIRAREMLAWSLEVKGDLDAELAVRQGLAVDAPTGANLNDYGRALERAADYPGARDEYADALQAGAKDPQGTIATLGAAHALAHDARAGGRILGAQRLAGERVAPASRSGAAVRPASRGVDDQPGTTNRAAVSRRASGSVTGLGAAVQLVARGGTSLVLGGDVRYGTASVSGNIAAGGTVPASDRQIWRAGAQAEVDAPLGAHVQINAHGDYDEQWAESPITIQEGGTTDGVTAHALRVSARSPPAAGRGHAAAAPDAGPAHRRLAAARRPGAVLRRRRRRAVEQPDPDRCAASSSTSA